MKTRRRPAVWLYGLVSGSDGTAPIAPPGARLLTFRGLSAIVSDVMPRRQPTGAPDPLQHAETIAKVFAQAPIVPVPPGVIFRRPDTLIGWLELHYGALHDALDYVDGRVEGRLHARVLAPATNGAGSHVAASEPTEADPPSVTQRLFEDLGHSAVAWTLAPSRDAAELSASFLVERSRWREFADAVAGAGRGQPALLVRLTGPWPPYDFVRLQFGG